MGLKFEQTVLEIPVIYISKPRLQSVVVEVPTISTNYIRFESVVIEALCEITTPAVVNNHFMPIFIN